MYSKFNTPGMQYMLQTDTFVCNRFGLAEFFAKHFDCFVEKQGMHVLDVGCGVLPIGIFLADQKRCKVTGIELNPTAYKCARKNIEILGLNDSVDVLHENFAFFSERYEGSAFDLIVSNPPINDRIPKEEILKYADDTFNRLDSKRYSYLTNSWHSSNGKDLMDYIFKFSIKNLKIDGRIMIVFCTIDCASPECVYKKAEAHGFVLTKTIEDCISKESIGFNSSTMEQVSIYMAEFRRR